MQEKCNPSCQQFRAIEENFANRKRGDPLTRFGAFPVFLLILFQLLLQSSINLPPFRCDPNATKKARREGRAIRKLVCRELPSTTSNGQSPNQPAKQQGGGRRFGNGFNADIVHNECGISTG